MLRLAAASGILEVLQTSGLDAEDLLHLDRFGYEPSPKARKRSKARDVPSLLVDLSDDPPVW